MKIGTYKEYRWLLYVILGIFILNAADGILTVFWVLNFKAVEANPFMQELVHNHPVIFITVKMTLVLLGSLLLWMLRYRWLAVIALFLVFLVYYYIVLYHLGEMNVLLITDWLKHPPTPPPTGEMPM